MATIQVGDKAPDFALPSDQGGDIRLKDFAGRTVVVYFYPKDDTTGCTNEAKAFTEAKPKFDALRAEIVGVSKDSIKSHGKFRLKYDLAIRLGSDVDGTVVESFGVWVQKSMYGRSYMGIERATFLIDGSGVVREVWRKVSVPGHVDAVLGAAQALTGE